MKRLVILVAIVMLLAGAGGAGWWFLLREAPAEDAMAAAEPVADDPNTQRVLELAPIVVPFLREGRVTQHLTLVLRIEFEGPEAEERVAEMRPRLRDAFLSELHGIFAFRHVQNQGEALPVLRERLFAVGNEVFGAGRVKAVLVQAASRRNPGEG